MMIEALPSQGNDHVSFDEDGEVSLSPMPPPPLRFSSYSLLEVSGMFLGEDACEVSQSTCSERTNVSKLSHPNRSDLWSRADCRTLLHFTSGGLGSIYRLAWHHSSRDGWRGHFAPVVNHRFSRSISSHHHQERYSGLMTDYPQTFPVYPLITEPFRVLD